MASKPLRAALWYAKRGWPVLALHTPDQFGFCSCGTSHCPSAGKHPRFHADILPHGVKSATTDPAIIKQWWGLWPDANVGVATGRASFDVLDVDVKTGGLDTLEDLQDQHGKLPDTMEQITGSGGKQFFFAYSGQIKNKVSFAPGLDTRSDGGYVVVPPSLHPSGNTYEWESSSRPDDSAPLATMPDWLLGLITYVAPNGNNGNGHGLDTAIIWEGLPEGERNSMLFRYAALLRNKNMLWDEAAVLVRAANRQCKPPLPEREVERIVQSAWKYEAGNSPSTEDLLDIFGQVPISLDNVGQSLDTFGQRDSSADGFPPIPPLPKKEKEKILLRAKTVPSVETGQKTANTSITGENGCLLDNVGQLPKSLDIFGQPLDTFGQHIHSLDNVGHLWTSLDTETVVRATEGVMDPDKVAHLKSMLTRWGNRGAEEKNLSSLIRNWVVSADGQFLTDAVQKDLGISNRVQRKLLSEVLRNLVKEGLIERADSRRGSFRTINRECEEIDWQSAPTEEYPVLFPPCFGLEKMVKIMPKNIIVIAGEQNAGKTAFLLETLRVNMRGLDCWYFSSEMGPSEFRERLSLYEDMDPGDWTFKARERSGDFADVIRPDALNCVDYLEVNDEFWKVSGMLKGIYDKLDKGVAIVALQKPPGRDVGRGGTMSLEKPRLYLSLSADPPNGNILKVVKAKNYRDKLDNPNGKMARFKLVAGHKFFLTDEWHHETNERFTRGKQESKRYAD